VSPARARNAIDRRITLAAALRMKFPGQTWNAVRRLCETGKVRVDGAPALDPAARVEPGVDVSVDMAAPRRREQVSGFHVVFEDGHLIVIEKPAGVSSVPFERKETGTALDLIRDHWRARNRRATTTPLYTVHRLDKETSGLLCFAKTRLAERGLHQIFQHHAATRAYLTVAHGAVTAGRLESRLLPDRGDGLRGSAPNRRDRLYAADSSDTLEPHGSRNQRDVRGPRIRTEGQHAVTHIEVVERLPAATYCRVRLETGRTHQIRIHLAEAGHPVVGDRVYTRDLVAAGGQPLPSERMMLHAATLGFDHPVTGEHLDFQVEPPGDFRVGLIRLGHRGSPT
jgi:23S rRNA pseudouridine1911/1915/1917 synthase